MFLRWDLLEDVPMLDNKCQFIEVLINVLGLNYFPFGTIQVGEFENRFCDNRPPFDLKLGNLNCHATFRPRIRLIAIPRSTPRTAASHPSSPPSPFNILSSQSPITSFTISFIALPLPVDVRK